jgi:hypothetical protein
MTIASLSTLPAARTIQAHWHAHPAPTTLYHLFASLPPKEKLALVSQVVLKM